MRLAHLAGISTFVTGGIGGVHRGASQTMDISADLEELSRTPVLVISAGIKSVLDIGLTLERLETLGIPVATYASSSSSSVPFPAFFSPNSEYDSPATLQYPMDVANAFVTARALNMNCGMLLAVPNDESNNNAAAGDKVESSIRKALKEVQTLGVTGRDVTPFVLKRVSEETGGASLRVNLSLVKRNAQVGACVALAIAELQRNIKNRNNTSSGGQYNNNTLPKTITRMGTTIGNINNEKSNFKNDIVDAAATAPSVLSSNTFPRVMVMGGSVVDIVASPLAGGRIISGTSVPGLLRESDGGVGRNIAEVLGRMGERPLFLSAVGDDSRGKDLVQRLTQECGVPDAEQLITIVPGANTPAFVALLDGRGGDDSNNNDENMEGGLHAAVAAGIDGVLRCIPVPTREDLAHVRALVMDANPPPEVLALATARATEIGTSVVALDPTSVPRAKVVSERDDILKNLTHIFPNSDELVAMASTFTATDEYYNSKHNRNKTNDEASLSPKFLEGLASEILQRMNPNRTAHVVTTLGSNGAFLGSRIPGSTSPPIFQWFSPPKDDNTDIEEEGTDSTGAGDTLCGAFIKSLMDGNDETKALQAGMVEAIKSLKCKERTIATNLSQISTVEV